MSLPARAVNVNSPTSAVPEAPTAELKIWCGGGCRSGGECSNRQQSVKPSPGATMSLYDPESPVAAPTAQPSVTPAPLSGPFARFEQDQDGRFVPSDEFMAELAKQSAGLEGAHPKEIIAWAVEHFYPRLAMATAFGPEGCLIIHYLAQIQPKTYVFNLDTGYQFPETLELRDRIARRYGLEVEMRRADTTVEQYEQLHGGPLYKSNPDQCCKDRKVKVLHASVDGMHAWMSGIRRDQSADRAQAAIVGWDKKFHLVKISPLASWTKNDVWKIVVDEDVPYNPLHDQGYTSIGCWPCTRAVMFGEDERAGRWSGSAKTECGLHSLND